MGKTLTAINTDTTFTNLTQWAAFFHQISVWTSETFMVEKRKVEGKRTRIDGFIDFKYKMQG